MTNKSLYITIFIIAVLGLLAGTNVVYQHFYSSNENQEYSVTQLNQKLIAAENQIRVIVNENNALRSELDSIRSKLYNLSEQLDGIGDIENKTERKNNNKLNKTRET